MREISKNKTNADETADEMYVFDPDIIDLTLLPPPATPDELDCALPTPISIPPISFADSVEKLDKLCALAEEQDLEEFLASVTVPPPTLKVTPSVELTPEEINSFIIPPPPTLVDQNGSRENSGELFIFEKRNIGNLTLTEYFQSLLPWKGIQNKNHHVTRTEEKRKLISTLTETHPNKL